MLYRFVFSICFTSTLYTSSFCSLNNVNPLGAVGSSTTENENSTGGWIPTDWLPKDLALGQVGGITVDANDTVYIFHRADRTWTSSSFTLDEVYANQDRGPINESTIVMVDQNGHVLKKLGEHIFYMPHGITVDHDFNIWVTDVALHQIMKFEPSSNDALLVKGTRFIPGKDSNHFCKPTSIAVLRNGDFFVADGYCNSRIVKFNSKGTKILEWGRSTIGHGVRNPGPGEFLIPHALTLTDDESLLCVADRENGRVQCFTPNNGTFSPVLSNLPKVGHFVYSVAFSKYNGGSFIVVNGWPYPVDNSMILGVVATLEGKIIGSFGVHLLHAPHDVATSANGNAIYVAEITTGGRQAWKFVRNGTATQNQLPYHADGTSSTEEKAELSELKSEDQGLAGAILITTACLIFSVAIIFSAFVYRRSRSAVAKDSVSLLSHSDI